MSDPDPAPIWKPRFNPWIIAVAVMAGAFMEVLDTTVTNVALPHVAGSLSATTEEATWMVTSYLVANAIVLPLTGWIGATFGRKNFLMVCIVAFTIASGLCGSAQTLDQLIFFRILQGVGGGALQPVAQSILLESFPPTQRGLAMAFYGLGVVVAPILGPILGGWFTDNYSWRWTFYINLPVGVVALLMVWFIIEDPPYLRQHKAGSVDFLGFLFLVIWVASLQVMLDKGQIEDWFESMKIVVLAVLFVVFLIGFVGWELTRKAPIVDLSIFRDRTYALSTAMITIVGAVLYGSLTLGPLFLQQLRGFSAFDAGLAVAPRGMGAMASMILSGALLSRMDGRILVFLGFILMGLANAALGHLSLDTGFYDVVLPNIFFGLGMGMVFVPLTTIANDRLATHQLGTASGVFNLMRNLGGGVGIALATTTLSRGAQTHQNQLIGHVNVYNPLLQQYQAALEPALGDPGWLGALYRVVQGQAVMLSYIDAYTLMTVACFACAPMVFFLRRATHGAGPGALH